MLLASLTYRILRLAPLNLSGCSTEKNSIKEPFAKVYFKVDLLKLGAINLLVTCIILRKSFNAPLLKCGMLSDTMLISKLGVFVALSISIGIIPNVFP